MNRELRELKELKKHMVNNFTEERKRELVCRELQIMGEGAKESIDEFKHNEGYLPLEILETTVSVIKSNIEGIFKDTTIDIVRDTVETPAGTEHSFTILYEGEKVMKFAVKTKKAIMNDDIRTFLRELATSLNDTNEDLDLDLDEFCDPRL